MVDRELYDVFMMPTFKIDATKEEYKKYIRSCEGIEHMEVDFREDFVLKSNGSR